MTIPRGTPCACRFLSGRVFAGFRIYPGSVRFILVITTNPGNLSLHLCVYLSTARFFPQRGDGGGTAARCAAQRWECFEIGQSELGFDDMDAADTAYV